MRFARGRYGIRLVLTLLAALQWFAPAHAEKRIALVIANEAYVSPQLGRLPGTKLDAQRISSALAKAGFPAPRVVTDLKRDAMKAAVADFVRQLSEAGQDGVGFLYYSGHGIADSKRGQNFLIPVEANIGSLAELPLSALPMDEILDAIESAGARAVFVVFDACRSTPTAFSRGSNGLVATHGRTDTLIAFATSPGETAADNGLYSRVLADELTKPGASSRTLFSDVQTAVAQASSRRQIPQFQSNLVEAVQFTSGTANRPAPVAPVAAPVPMAPVARAPASTGNATALVAECERLAFGAFDDILPTLAIPACTKALAAAPGRSDSLRNLGRAYEKAENYAEARSRYEQAAASGDADAMVGLGAMHDSGKGVREDPAEARRWYLQAIAKGNAAAMVSLGNLYHDGRGVPQSYAQAKRWYEQAAAKGRPSAMTNLGLMYHYGQGVPVDLAAARRWYEKAARLGSDAARANLAALQE